VLQLPGARAGHLAGCWRLAQNLAVTSGWALGVGGERKCRRRRRQVQKCRSAEMQRDTASLPLHASLHSSLHLQVQQGRKAVLHDSHSHIFRVSGRSIFGAGPWTLLAAKLCLPPVEIARCRAKHASGCHSTVDDSLVRVYWQHISGIVAQSSQSS
jgi:hypothetical protein